MIRSFMADVAAADAALETAHGDDGGEGEASTDPVAEEDTFLADGLSSKLGFGFLTTLTSVFFVGWYPSLSEI